MTRPTTTLTLRVPVGDVLAAREAGIVGAPLLNALWRSLDALGPLEVLALEREHEEYRSEERARDAARKGANDEG